MVTTTGAAYCWGLNSYGPLGNGSRTHSSVPVKVAGQPWRYPRAAPVEGLGAAMGRVTHSLSEVTR